MECIATALVLSALLVCGARAAESPTLTAVKARGQLICGANGQLAGFAIKDSRGNWTGLDVDFCRAIAAAIFNDPNKVKFVAVTAADRFTALRSRQVDVLARNTAWTMSRGTTPGIDFVVVNFYDGQGFIVHKALKVSSALELNGATICVPQGTSAAHNLADYFRSHNMSLKTAAFATRDEAIKAYDSGRCDAYTADWSALHAERLQLSNPSDNIVLPEIIAKEPFSPAVRQGDDVWENVVRWTHEAMVDAEELGVTSRNVDAQLEATNPEIRRLLGVEGQFGKSLGLSNDWAYRIIKYIGNYGESFERNVGDGSPLKSARGLNALWSKGGLQYGLPIR